MVLLKLVLRLFYSVILGAVVLIAINFVGGLLHFSIAVNIVSSCVVGLLGIPGVLLLIILKYLFT